MPYFRFLCLASVITSVARPVHGQGTPGPAPIVGTLAGADPFPTLGSTDLRGIVGGYYAYFGRYQVSAAGDSIAHLVETSLRPNEVGVTYRRAIRIDGQRLFISLHAEAGGVPRHRVLTWRRAL